MLGNSTLFEWEAWSIICACSVKALASITSTSLNLRCAHTLSEYLELMFEPLTSWCGYPFPAWRHYEHIAPA